MKAAYCDMVLYLTSTDANMQGMESSALMKVAKKEMRVVKEEEEVRGYKIGQLAAAGSCR